jgi:type II secretory pathway component GspD/PulD (secretin)
MITTKLFIVLCLSATAFAACADNTSNPKQSPPTAQVHAPSSLVSVSANGTDVRLALHDLFSQMNLNYVIEPNTKYSLYLSLDKVDFDEALGIVCHLAKLKAEKQNGIYYVTADTGATKSPTHPVQPSTKDVEKASTRTLKLIPTTVDTSANPAVGWKTLKTKMVTTRLPKTSIKKVMAELSDQTGIPITLDPLVPDYKLDAFLNHTSLKYALDHIMAATHLHYSIVDRTSIKITLEGDSLILVNP